MGNVTSIKGFKNGCLIDTKEAKRSGIFCCEFHFPLAGFLFDILGLWTKAACASASKLCSRLINIYVHASLNPKEP